MPLVLWIFIVLSALGTAGLFIFMAAAEIAERQRARQQAQFRAQVKAAQDEARRALRLRGRVPVDADRRVA